MREAGRQSKGISKQDTGAGGGGGRGGVQKEKEKKKKKKKKGGGLWSPPIFFFFFSRARPPPPHTPPHPPKAQGLPEAKGQEAAQAFKVPQLLMPARHSICTNPIPPITSKCLPTWHIEGGR